MASSSFVKHCDKTMPAVSSGILQGDISLNFALPLLTLQIALVLLVTRTMAALFKPMKQPRVLAEIIGGVVLGPTALGRNKLYMEKMFPPQSLPLLDTVANMGLMFFIFMVGLELDLKALRRTGKNALLVGVAGIIVPFGIAATLASVVQGTISKGSKWAPLVVFMGIPLSMSAFSVLVRIMGEVKLLSTQIGKIAVPAAAINDVAIWTLLAVGVALSGGGGKGGGKRESMKPLWVVLSGLGFGLGMMTLVRKTMESMVKRAMKKTNNIIHGRGQDSRKNMNHDGQAEERSNVGEIYVTITLLSVLLAGFCSDALGVHPLFGPFLLGLVIPKDTSFPHIIIEKIEDIVTGIFLPLFFASSGLKTNLAVLHGASSMVFLLVFIATAVFGKITATFVSARLLIGLSPRKALILSFLMNTKGLGVLIVLNIGKDIKVLSDETFAILVVTCLLTTCMTTPIVIALSKPYLDEINKASLGTTTITIAKDSERNLELVVARKSCANIDTDSEGTKDLRIFACADHHITAHFASMVNLIEACRGATSMKLYTLRFLHISSLERPSDIHNVLTNTNLQYHLTSPESKEQDTHSKEGKVDDHMTDDVYYQNIHSEQPIINVSFHPSPHLCDVDVTPLTRAIAQDDLHTLHHDICKLVDRYCGSIILLPHASSLQDHEAMLVNQGVLDHAPCSVGILVTKAGSLSTPSSTIPICPCFFSYKVLVIFIGGRDDRGALAFASQMVRHPGVDFKLVRFLAIETGGHKKTRHDVDDDDADADADADADDDADDDGTDVGVKASRELDDKAILKLKEISSSSCGLGGTLPSSSFTYEEAEYTNIVGSAGDCSHSLAEAVERVVLQVKDVVNMFIVGRRRSRIRRRRRRRHPNVAMADKGYSYLGVVGDVVSSATRNCGAPQSQASVIVIQSAPECRFSSSVDPQSAS